LETSIAPVTAAEITVPPVTTPEITAADVLERNPLYAAVALQDAGCSTVASVPLDSVDNVRGFYESMMPCLEAAWTQIAADTGLAVRPAGLQVFTGASASSCLTGVTYSFYCSDDETIYMYADEMIRPWLEFPTDYSHGITRLAAVHTLAHEYGHHIQGNAGIFGVLGAEFAGTEAERRLELQASCLANVFLSSQVSAYPIAPEYLDVQNLWRFITVVPNHGSEANQALWTDVGYQSATPGQCNTFSALAEQVV
jgi:predicted metalloprotease